MTDRNALYFSIDRMTEVFGSPGKAALRLFLSYLPPDAKITWDKGLKVAAVSVVAERLMDELAGDSTPKRGKVIRLKHITREMVRADTNTLWVFGDNMARAGYGGQAAEMRGEPNTIGVPTKWRPTTSPEAYFIDDDWLNDRVALAIHSAFRSMREALDAGRNVVIPADGLGTGLADLPRRAPRIYRAIEERIAALEAIGHGVLRDATVHMIVTTDSRTYISTGKE